MNTKYLWYAAGGAVLLFLWGLRSLASGSEGTGGAIPSVPGTVTSGSQSTDINVNVLSPDFGHPITPVLKE